METRSSPGGVIRLQPADARSRRQMSDVGRNSRSVAAIGVLVLGLLLALPTALTTEAAAQAPTRTPQSEEVARRAIGELRSPYCPGLMLEVCPSGEAEALRDSIRMLAAGGMSADALVEWMIGNHGEEWRAVPKRAGLGLWAWVLPPAALLLGLGVLTLRLRTLRQAGPAEVPASSLTADEEAELGAALAALEAAEEERV